jgi:D-serine deaminase-like pyridoxal phosphate-dependent protein
MTISDIDTPALLINGKVLEKNLERMYDLCQSKGIKLRPHIKTHKMSGIALQQVRLSNNGIAVSKLSEAEVMVEAGINDIQIANEIVGKTKIERLSLLNEKAQISVCVDSAEGVGQLERYLISKSKKQDVLIEIDTGMRRCGIEPGPGVARLAKSILNCSKLNFIGIMSHAGNVYGAAIKREVEKIAFEDAETMRLVAEDVRRSGIEVKEVSIGSTPSTIILSEVNGITEFRPGNYVFNDNIQIALGVAEDKDCALSVLSTVISKPASNRIIIDAGSKSLGLDRGAHSKQLIKGFGLVRGYPDLIIDRLSEEHGIVISEACNEIKIGNKLEIIPNHACSVVNLFQQVFLTDGEQITNSLTIDARGKSQ